MENLRNYLLGSTFTIYTDNNPLVYVKESRLDVAEIRWLSEPALFDFDIKYRSGKLNQAANTLSHHPRQRMKISATLKVMGMKLYHTVICDDLSVVIKGEKLPLEVKKAVQAEITQQAPDCEKINVYNEMVDILSRVTPCMTKEAQKEDFDTSKTIYYVKSGRKLTLAKIKKIKSRPV